MVVLGPNVVVGCFVDVVELRIEFVLSKLDVRQVGVLGSSWLGA